MYGFLAIPDDPIISSMERTGYPPRYRGRHYYPGCEICDDDYYEDMARWHDEEEYLSGEPMAVYDPE